MLNIIITIIVIFFIAYNEAKNSKLEPFDLYITASFYEKYDVLWSGENKLVKVVVVSGPIQENPLDSKYVYKVMTCNKQTPAIWIKFIIWIKY